MKINFLLIPILTVLVAATGSLLAQTGMQKWYRSIKLPRFAPPGAEIGIIWTIIYILTATAILVLWNSHTTTDTDRAFLGIMFIINALMNIFWVFLFFYAHMVGYAAIESAGLGLSVLALIVYSYPISLVAAALLAPYFIWVCFATYINYSVWKLNP